MRSYFLIPLLLCAALVACGCMGTAPAAPDTAATATPTPTPTDTGVSVPTPDGKVTTLGGAGNATRVVALDAGLYVFAMQHDGTGPFSVEVESEEVYGTLAHAAGAYDGEQAFGLPASGEYEFTVVADGNWTVTVDRPQAINGIPPQTFTGTGDGATPLFQIPAGNASFAMTIQSPAECAVWLYNSTGWLVFDPTGTYVEPLHWHRGPYNGTATVRVADADNYLLNVMTEGPWTITVTV